MPINSHGFCSILSTGLNSKTQKAPKPKDHIGRLEKLLFILNEKQFNVNLGKQTQAADRSTFISKATLQFI